MTTQPTPEQLAKSQAAFEAHYLGYHNMTNDDFSKTDGLYNFSYLHRDFEKWRAAEAFGRKQALEDVAEGFIKQKSWLRDYAYVVVEHAAEEGATE